MKRREDFLPRVDFGEMEVFRGSAKEPEQLFGVFNYFKSFLAETAL